MGTKNYWREVLTYLEDHQYEELTVRKVQEGLGIGTRPGIGYAIYVKLTEDYPGSLERINRSRFIWRGVARAQVAPVNGSKPTRTVAKKASKAALESMIFEQVGTLLDGGILIRNMDGDVYVARALDGATILA